MQSFVIRTDATQTVKKVSAEHDVLVETFECIETFLRRLETYTEVAPNQECWTQSQQ